MTKERTIHDRSQRERFEEAARSLECDESGERFDAALKKIAAHKPKKDKADEINTNIGGKTVRQNDGDTN
jgi:hypothetical protein